MSTPSGTKELILATEDQLAEWVEKFAAYRHRPTKEALLTWLKRFSPDNLEIGHKVLNAVLVVSEIEIHRGYRDSLSNLEGWSIAPDKRQGRWYFVGVGSAGESGPAMLRMFREANGLTSAKWQEFFVTAKELPRLALSAYDQVIFVDDFAGSGKQMVDYWPIMEELVASEARCYLLLTAATKKASDAIAQHTELVLHTPITLEPSANVFSEECTIFTKEEKDVIANYGTIAWRDHPRGYGECGLTIVLSHKTPNNSLPILHANHRRWVGPFPRNLIGAT